MKVYFGIPGPKNLVVTIAYPGGTSQIITWQYPFSQILMEVENGTLNGKEANIGDTPIGTTEAPGLWWEEGLNLAQNLTGPHHHGPFHACSRRRINLRLPFWTSMLHALFRPDAEKGEPPDVDELMDGFLWGFWIKSGCLKRWDLCFFFRKCWKQIINPSNFVGHFWWFTAWNSGIGTTHLVLWSSSLFLGESRLKNQPATKTPGPRKLRAGTPTIRWFGSMFAPFPKGP